MSKDGEISTQDIYFVAFLLTNDQKIKNFEKADARVVFSFDDSDELKGLTTQWMNKEAMVNAIDFADNLKHVKSMCFRV